jgi:hypothetical protein
VETTLGLFSLVKILANIPLSKLNSTKLVDWEELLMIAIAERSTRSPPIKTELQITVP